MRRVCFVVLWVAGAFAAVLWVACASSVRRAEIRDVSNKPVPRSSTSQSGIPDESGPHTGPTLAAAEPSRDWTSVNRRIVRKSKIYSMRGPKPFDAPQEAMDFFMAQRLPIGMSQFPIDELRKSYDTILAREALLKASRGPLAGAPLTWTELGPGNIGGRTRAMVINPDNPNIMYAAGVAGGVWKTIDAGANWFPTDDFMLNIAVCSLAMDPSNSNVLYAGTGEGFFNGDAVRGLGIFKSTDAGATWTHLTDTAYDAFFRVNDLAVSPSNPDHVYACTRFGVYKTTTAGMFWFPVLENTTFINTSPPNSNGSTSGCMELALRADTPPGPDVVFASFGSFDTDGLFRSADGGISWTQVGTTSDLIVTRQGRMSLAIAPSNNDIMYVAMADNGIGAPTGTIVNVFRSSDGGLTWTPQLTPSHPINPYLLSNMAFSNGCFGSALRSQGWYDNVIAVDPLDPNIVWVGGIDLFRSEDGGQTFKVASYWFFDPGDLNYLHADHHVLVFHPDFDGASNQTLYSGTDGGLARTDNARAAVSTNDCPTSSPAPLPAVAWTGLNNNYGTAQFYHGDAANQEDTFAGGTQDNGVLLTNSAVDPNAWRQVVGGDGGYFAIDPTNNDIMYTETQRFPAMLKSIDGGEIWESAINGIFDIDGLFITPFAMDPVNPLVLWTGGQRPWRTTDGAANWSLAGNDFPSAGTISAIAIAPSNNNIVFLGFNNGYVAKTLDGLAPSPTWTVFNATNGLNIGAYVSSVAIHPSNPNIVYATYSTFNVTHVLRSVDGGTTWTPIDTGVDVAGVPDIPVHWIAIRPCDPNQLFLGTELGVFDSDDGGATWNPANTGLSHTVVEALDFPDNYHLVAFTHGRGAFRAELDCPCGTGPTVDCNNNGNPDECDLAFGISPDCDDNGVPDECDVVSGAADCDGNLVPDVCEEDCNANSVVDACDVDPSDPDGNGVSSPDCDGNLVPDECQQDCNANGVPDTCDIDPSDPDGNGSVSADCNNNGFPDECDVTGGGLLMSVDFESGLPAGWTAQFPFVVTNFCSSGTPCSGTHWAYSGSVFGCEYGDNETAELISPPIPLGNSTSELRFCQNLESEEGFDFAEVFVNGQRVFRESGSSNGWEEVVIDLTSFAGQAVTITWRFTSDGGVSGYLGWQVDFVRVTSGSADCNADEVPDECNTDMNGNGIPDACEAICCLGGGVCTPSALGDPNPCILQGGAYVQGVSCAADCQPNGLPDACETVESGVDCNADLVPDECQLADNDCNANGVPDECDPDQDGNGVPDDCEIPPPLAATSYPNSVLKSRYISFVPDPSLLGELHGYEVKEIVGGESWFISTPRTTPASIAAKGLCFLVSDEDPPLYDFATLPVISVGGCLISPGDAALAPDGRRYEVRTTLDGVKFSQPLSVYTNHMPTNDRWWGDVVGQFSMTGDPTTTPPTPPNHWTPPDGRTNGFDIGAVLQGFSGLPSAPDTTWSDVNPSLPDRVTNGADALQVVNAFATGSGKEFYPFPVPDPPGDQGQAGCPAPPLQIELNP
ncbi:MAG: hypothetical protein J5J06_15040 [Phycisphaerae bacterium]|nr:hypothetical protein [Phycisphaerae bacterium]